MWKFSSLLALSLLPLLTTACLIVLDSSWMSVRSRDVAVTILLQVLLVPLNVAIIFYSLFTAQTIIESTTGRRYNDGMQYTHLLVLFYLVLANLFLTLSLGAFAVYRNLFTGKEKVPGIFMGVVFAMALQELFIIHAVHSLHPDLFGQNLREELERYKRARRVSVGTAV
jgi:hypothetical protein